MGKTKGYAEAGIDVVKDFRQDISDKWNDIRDWGQDKIDKANTFITHNTDQLNVNTETFQTVKQVYKEYRDKGLDINQFDIDKYIDQQGSSSFFDRLDNSTMVNADMYPNGVFLSEREANIAYANQANPITIADNRETGTIIIKVPVTMEDSNGVEYTVNMYTTDDIY